MKLKRHEHQAVSPVYRQAIIWRPGQRKEIKVRLHRRERRAVRAQLRGLA